VSDKSLTATTTGKSTRKCSMASSGATMAGVWIALGE
jgi:hypothetical protein